RDQNERLYRIVNDLLIATNPATPGSLRQLAAITDLRLFVSTTFDSLLARAVDEVRFGGSSGTTELSFAPNQSTQDQQRNSKAPVPGQSVVFQLFGRVSSTPQYALHDEDVLEWLHALMTDTARLPEWIGYQLRESPLLFIGCRIPDWVGRFLVRMASSTRLSLASKQFFIVGNSSREPQLSEFFQTYCGATRVQMYNADPAEFVAELHERWRARNPKGEAAEDAADSTDSSRSARGSIFISYVREDAEPALRLCEAITALGGDVWFDEQRLQPGDEWDEEILTSIRRDIRLFVPVISRQTELRDEGYVFREWTDALKRADAIMNRRFIVPVVIDTQYDGNPDRFKQIQDGLRRFQFGHAPNGQPDAMLTATLTEEIRAMRRGEAA
ncbi:MAG: toll/interleukin-1 receptor domain-containing protein, partial [Gemmatimonadaceae bacterium]|nr:toll/interleukin-1 receptor domain-containing protein [Gemmatimonadaceae bacterium]